MVSVIRSRDRTILVLLLIGSSFRSIEAFTASLPKISSRHSLSETSITSTKSVAFILNHFPPSIRGSQTFIKKSTSLFASSSDDEIDSMKVSELRKELAEYGISTKSFFEKSDFVQALRKARAEGKKKTGSKSKPSSSSSSESGTQSRKEKIALEIENISSTMKVGEMKKELISMGIATRSFFEKSEFVKALAEARVDGKKASGGASSGSGTNQQQEEEYDATYRDVVMQKYTSGGRLGGFGGPSGIIDVRLG